MPSQHAGSHHHPRVDDDDSVRRLKGADRPVINAGERVGILSALDSVDYVVVFATHELDAVIKAIRPDILTKGSNYESEDVAGRQIVEIYGGRVELIPITEEISSSQIKYAIDQEVSFTRIWNNSMALN